MICNFEILHASLIFLWKQFWFTFTCFQHAVRSFLFHDSFRLLHVNLRFLRKSGKLANAQTAGYNNLRNACLDKVDHKTWGSSLVTLVDQSLSATLTLRFSACTKRLVKHENALAAAPATKSNRFSLQECCSVDWWHVIQQKLLYDIP